LRRIKGAGGAPGSAANPVQIGWIHLIDRERLKPIAREIPVRSDRFRSGREML